MRYEILKTIGTHIQIPDSMMCLRNGEILSHKHIAKMIDAPTKKLVVYYDSTFCTPCQASELNVWDNFTKIKKDNFLPIFIFSPKKKDKEMVEMELEMMKYDFPVFVDSLGLFRKNNSQLALDYLNFHFMLLDEKSIVQIIGMPLNSEKVTRRYLNEINDVSFK